MATKYVVDTDDEGWLSVRRGRKPDGLIIALPKYLKVDVLGEANGREEFKILEGYYAGEFATVKKKGPKQSFFGAATHDSSAQVNAKIDRASGWGEIRFGPLGPYGFAMANDDKPLADQLYDLYIPDYYHDLAAKYKNFSSYACTWFRIGPSNGDHYLHPGRLTSGCIAITDGHPTRKQSIDVWTAIYNYLIKRRKGNGKSVGMLKLESTP